MKGWFSCGDWHCCRHRNGHAGARLVGGGWLGVGRLLAGLVQFSKPWEAKRRPRLPVMEGTAGVWTLALPEALGGAACALAQGLQFGERNLRVDPAAQAAVGGCDDVLAAYDFGKADNAVCHQVGVFHHVGGV